MLPPSPVTGGRMSEKKTKICRCFKTHCCPAVSKCGAGAGATVTEVLQSTLRSKTIQPGQSWLLKCIQTFWSENYFS